MIYRDECRCPCHRESGIIHFMPCCRERPRMLLAFMMGPTHVGKSTAIRAILERGSPERSQECGSHQVGAVEVGKMMRAKYLDPNSPHYTPDKFKGQAAPKETQAEAWQMLLDGIELCRTKGDHIVLIDGQPRDYQQARDALLLPDPQVFVSLFAPIAERQRRFEASDRARNPEDRSLSERRMTGDLTMLYECLNIVHVGGAEVHYHDTSSAEYDPCHIYIDLCRVSESRSAICEQPHPPIEGPMG